MANRSSIFVRPNLKGFVLGGIIVITFHCVLQQIEGLTTDLTKPPVPIQVGKWTDVHYRAVLDYVTRYPTSDGYLRLGSYLEHKRDHRGALMYLKKAEMLAGIEADSE